MAQAKTLTQAELDQVLRYASTKKYPERNRALILTSFLTGMRVAEIASLTMGDVLNQDGSIKNEIRLSAQQTKGGHPRTVFISSKLKGELEPYLKTRHIKEPGIPFFIQAIGSDLLPMDYAYGFIGFIATQVLAVLAAIVAEETLLQPWPIKESV